MNTVFETTALPIIKQEQEIESEVNDGLVIIITSVLNKTDNLISKMRQFRNRYIKK